MPPPVTRPAWRPRRGQYVPNQPELRSEGAEVAERGSPAERTGIICKPFHWVSSANTNPVLVVGATAWLWSVWVTNINAAIRYVKFFDLAKPPVAGIDLPMLTLGVPGNAAGAGGSQAFPRGATFESGLGFCITAGAADLDATAVAAGEIILNITYEYRNDAKVAPDDARG